MEARDPRTNVPEPVSQDDSGLWMKLDSGPMTEHTGSQSGGSDGKPQAAPTVVTRYYTVMDEEGADDVFVPPPPAFTAPLLPTEGSTEPSVDNSSVTLSNGAADATEAEANPSGLDGHHGEKHLMATQVDVHTSKQSEHTVSVPSDKNCRPATDRDPASVETTAGLMDTCSDPCGTNQQEGPDGDSFEEPGDTARQKDLGTAERKEHPEETPSKMEENSETSGSNEKESTLKAGHANCDRIGTNTPTVRGLSVNDDDDFKDALRTSADEPDEELVDTMSLSYNLTESGTSETQLPTADGLKEMVMKGEQGDGIRKIVSEIQQGEELLQRLQLVQQRQDKHMSGPLASQKDVQHTGHADEFVLATGSERLTAAKVDQNANAQTNLMDQDISESKETEPRMRLSWKPDTKRAEAENSNQSGDWAPNEESGPKASEQPTRHRFSAAETSMEIQQAAPRTQSLQRAGGVFNLAENPDVLEIPFQTNIVLKPFPPYADLSQDRNRQFSEQKVHQGKIPAGYSKGAVPQFEAFQQGNTEGPTRNRTPTLPTKGHVYPSILERTRSLEMFSLSSCSVTRAHSLRLYKSGTPEEKVPEIIRSKSPPGGARDKTRLSPYPMKDKHLHAHRSMDSLRADGPASAVEAQSRTSEGNARRESPILKRNPFFKLRPALALQPEVEKDIREAREREQELRRQRCSLYGENRQDSQDEEKTQLKKTPGAGVQQQTAGKLERVWPPPTNKDQMKCVQAQVMQQEPRAQRTLWQRWESGLINGQRRQEGD